MWKCWILRMLMKSKIFKHNGLKIVRKKKRKHKSNERRWFCDEWPIMILNSKWFDQRVPTSQKWCEERCYCSWYIWTHVYNSNQQKKAFLMHLKEETWIHCVLIVQCWSWCMFRLKSNRMYVVVNANWVGYKSF